MISFRVLGTPAPQGSKIRTRYGMRESSQAVMPWREAVKAAALVQKVGKISGPVIVEMMFRFKRPANHYGTGRNRRRVKPTAPDYPTGRNRGDIDKLARATCDALTEAGVIDDDCMIAELIAVKVWGPTQGASITVQAIGQRGY